MNLFFSGFRLRQTNKERRAGRIITKDAADPFIIQQ